MKEKNVNFGVKSYVCSLALFWNSTKITLNDSFKNSYIHREAEKRRGDDSTLECGKQMDVWQMSIKIKKANWRTKPIYTIKKN